MKKKKRGGGRKKSKRRHARGNRRFWLILGLLLLCVINLVLLDALISFKRGWHFLPRCVYTPVISFFSPGPAEQPPPPKPQKAEKPAPPDEAPPQETRPERRPGPPKVDVHRHKPCVALVIDDLGYNPELSQELFRIDVPFTVSMLPNLPHTEPIAQRAFQKGKEVILHLPMEPYDYPNGHVEEGTLLVSMSDAEIRRRIAKALKGLDCVVGANNHMGSRMVEHEEKMGVILEEMRERRLFFLDSRTSPKSVVYDLAHKMGVKTAKRHVFLDGEEDREYIRKQLDQVVDVAMNNGYGIAIGHLNPTTVEVLSTYLPQLSKQGIRFVKLSEVME